MFFGAAAVVGFEGLEYCDIAAQVLLIAVVFYKFFEFVDALREV